MKLFPIPPLIGARRPRLPYSEASGERPPSPEPAQAREVAAIRPGACRGAKARASQSSLEPHRRLAGCTDRSTGRDGATVTPWLLADPPTARCWRRVWPRSGFRGRRLWTWSRRRATCSLCRARIRVVRVSRSGLAWRRARVGGGPRTDQRALAVITWVNRGTLHLIAAEDEPLLHALTTPQLRSNSDRRLRQEGVSPGPRGAGSPRSSRR